MVESFPEVCCHFILLSRYDLDNFLNTKKNVLKKLFVFSNLLGTSVKFLSLLYVRSLTFPSESDHVKLETSDHLPAYGKAESEVYSLITFHGEKPKIVVDLKPHFSSFLSGSLGMSSLEVVTTILSTIFKVFNYISSYPAGGLMSLKSFSSLYMRYN